MTNDNPIQRLKILVVEDRQDTRAMLRNMLSELGITQIYEATDGREGLEFIDIAPDMVDIVICDWNMPRMAGIDLLRQIRSADPQMPFVMVTGRSDMASVSEAKGGGVTAYIRKPFSPNQLEAKLRVIYHRIFAGDDQTVST